MAYWQWQEECKVEALFTETGAWNVPLIQSLFLSHEAKMILSLPMGLRTIPDKLMWHYMKFGSYSVKTRYWVARDLATRKGASMAGSSSSNVSAIWKKKWKITTETICRQCGASVESTLHVLWDCPNAKRVWKLSFLSEVCKIWKEPSVMDLFSMNLQRHDERCLKPEELIAAAWEWQIQYELANTRMMHSNSVGSESASAAASSPSNTQVWSPPGVCGVGAVFRDQQGRLRGALAIAQVGNLSPRAVESLALLHGLKFALHVGFTKLEIEGDALIVLNTLHDDSEDLCLEGHILDEVKHLVKSFISCSWRFVRRDYNKVAHRLAKEALSLSQPLLCLESGPS
ncbi:uncharacterized protein LOC112194577 [Rosa chinensis]|uniref:uncharacterized protein LOC112194577 n=1 Tax=Rosa chinensis TaxID=74649 RepID=UPI000D08FC4B|nr:uncharacterized protein LOC112194577 [Rosa chinensis]